MCGIAGAVGSEHVARVRKGVAALAHRGPDASAVEDVEGVVLGHARLAIQDLDPRSNQPFRRGSVVLAYNGELWNAPEVRADLEKLGHEFSTPGDTEVVAAALDQWGADALPRLNGMFALAWTRGDGKVSLARDRFGEIPLHFGRGAGLPFASEVKALKAMGATASELVPPGGLVEGDRRGVARVSRWYDPPAAPSDLSVEEARAALRERLRASSRERAVSDVPVCTLLSGGIDSAVVALHLKEVVPNLVAYTAVLDPKSLDLRMARAVAERVGIELREVRVQVPTADDLARVIRVIEMPHKAQVEIGWACLKLAERMQADGCKVTFSGEGSDELWASYGFAYHALAAGEDWHDYRKKLFLDQNRKNFARCNKIFMAHSVECRLPFLNPGLVELALSLPKDVVQDGRSRPKAVLQEAYRGLLPERVIDRPKVAFQDGMGLKKAIAGGLPDPKRFYLAERARLYGGLE